MDFPSVLAMYVASSFLYSLLKPVVLLQVIAPQVYELDNTKAFEMSNSDHTEAHRDIERFGIL